MRALLTRPLAFFLQSLQNKSYNHFAAIYYLLVERLKAHRCSFPVEQRLDARQRRPSTIAEQTVVKVRARGGREALWAAFTDQSSGARTLRLDLSLHFHGRSSAFLIWT